MNIDLDLSKGVGWCACEHMCLENGTGIHSFFQISWFKRPKQNEVQEEASYCQQNRSITSLKV